MVGDLDTKNIRTQILTFCILVYCPDLCLFRIITIACDELFGCLRQPSLTLTHNYRQLLFFGETYHRYVVQRRISSIA